MARKLPRNGTNKRGKEEAKNAQPVFEDPRIGLRTVTLEAWSIDVLRRQWTFLSLPQTLLQEKLSEMTQKQDAWDHYMLLKSYAKAAIDGLMEAMNDEAQEKHQDLWTLLLIENPKSLGDDWILQVVIGQNQSGKGEFNSSFSEENKFEVFEKPNDPSRGWTKISSNLVVPEVLDARGLLFAEVVYTSPLSEGVSIYVL